MIMRIPILKSILRNLDWFEEARQHHKAPEGTIFVGGINHRLKKEDWAEQKHPRADDGKFTSGSGGGSKKPSKTKRKLERRAEAASQGRVSGAIQTLLSGGSALDKIGWLNTSKPKEPEKKPESKPQQPEKPTAEEKPKAKVSLADQATKLKLKDLKELSLGKLRSMQSALQKHPKFRNPAYPEGKKYDKALRMVEGAIYSKV